jgi:hypothetical protein
MVFDEFLVARLLTALQLLRQTGHCDATAGAHARPFLNPIELDQETIPASKYS